MLVRRLLQRLVNRNIERLRAAVRVWPTLDLSSMASELRATGVGGSCQLDYVRDESDLAVALCGRRSGKTSANRLLLVKTALENAGSLAVLVHETRGAAKKQYWLQLQKLLRGLGVPFRVNGTELRIVLANDSEIWLAGAATSADIERLRGYAFALVIVDEAQAIRESILRTLVEDVLQWALLDEEGKLRLTGTPPPVPVGYFVERFQGEDAEGKPIKGWARHRWTVYQNKFLGAKKVAAYLQRIKVERGMDESSPGWLREVLGELAYDRNALVLSAYDIKGSVLFPRPALEGQHITPEGKATCVIGVDIGWHDADAIVVLGWFADSPNLYVLEEYEAAHNTEEALAKELQRMIRTWEPLAVVADTGGGGKKTVEGVARRLQYPLKAAHKPGVVTQFARLNDEFRAGRLFTRAGGNLAHDAIRMRWEPGKVGVKVAQSPHYNTPFAAAYGLEEARHYFHRPEPDTGPRLTALEQALAKTMGK